MDSNFQKKFEVLCSQIAVNRTYKEKLNTWADFTVDYCHNLAINKIDRSFYVFQSEPQENPQILILGLNPYGTYQYNSMFNSPIDGWGLNNFKKMIPKVFIHQNPWYNDGKNAEDGKEWNILKNLAKTINITEDFSKLFYNMVYMNILYFNSKDFNEFKNSFKEHWQIVYENCIKLSSLLIFEVIKPEKIICLGIYNCFNPFVGNAVTEVLIKGHLHKYKKNNVNIYGITHPSARVSNFLRENIGWHIFADLSQKSIMISLEKKIIIIENILCEIAKTNRLLFYVEKDKLNKKFGSFTFNHELTNRVIYFEFQNSFCSDLRYGLHNKNGFIHKAIKCAPPFDNWMDLGEAFNHKDLKNYFSEIIRALI